MLGISEQPLFYFQLITMTIPILLPKLTYCCLIHSCIHHILEVRIIEISLHKLCLLLQHSCHNRHHVIIECNLSHLAISIPHGIHKTRTASDALRQLVDLALYLVTILPVYILPKTVYLPKSMLSISPSV